MDLCQTCQKTFRLFLKNIAYKLDKSLKNNQISNMIQAKSLTKRYGSRKAISDVGFTINKGEVVGFLGPNGAGKTTTMKILTGYMAPNKGEVLLDGVNVFKEPFTAKRKLVICLKLLRFILK